MLKEPLMSVTEPRPKQEITQLVNTYICDYCEKKISVEIILRLKWLLMPSQQYFAKRFLFSHTAMAEDV